MVQRSITILRPMMFALRDYRKHGKLMLEHVVRGLPTLAFISLTTPQISKGSLDALNSLLEMCWRPNETVCCIQSRSRYFSSLLMEASPIAKRWEIYGASAYGVDVGLHA
mmetsp:Transcript_93880/g.148309  ORF Transcript_93880/g.148309 Transcript_93880/m.148309 type:complete len:110 (-) Transcript_93880:35-364(-)